MMQNATASQPTCGLWYRDHLIGLTVVGGLTLLENGMMAYVGKHHKMFGEVVVIGVLRKQLL